MTVRVTAPAVQVAIGARVHHLTRGTVLPDGVADETIKRLAAKGLVEIVKGEPKQPKADKQPDEPPAGDESKK